MTRNSHVRLMLTLLLLLLLAGCATAAPAPADTPAAVSPQSLEQVVLQSSEIDPAFTSVELDDIENAFPNTPDVLPGIQDSAVMIATTDAQDQVISNAVVQYETAAQAAGAYAAIKNSTRGGEETFEIDPPLGDEQFAIHDVISGSNNPNEIHLVLILWRQGSDLAYVSYAETNAQPDLDMVVGLARLVDGRME